MNRLHNTERHIAILKGLPVPESMKMIVDRQIKALESLVEAEKVILESLDPQGLAEEVQTLRAQVLKLSSANQELGKENLLLRQKIRTAPKLNISFLEVS